MFQRRLPPIMERLHMRLEFFDEYENPQRGFFMTELDHNTRGTGGADRPVLVYVRNRSLEGPNRDTSATPRPPDWMGEVLHGRDTESKLERYARAGVPELWQVLVDRERAEVNVDAPEVVEIAVHTQPVPGEGRYAQTETYTQDQAVRSTAFAGLKLTPADLLREAPDHHH